jgi:hypothetical protein
MAQQGLKICQKLSTGQAGHNVPLLGGENAKISHKRVTHAEKTLGTMTSPDGNSEARIQMMQGKAQQWIDLVCNGVTYIIEMYGSL